MVSITDTILGNCNKATQHLINGIIYIGERINIYKKRKLYSQVSLSSQQREKIDSLYKESYGKKISYKWHRLYQSYMGTFDASYLPEIIYSTKLEPRLNPRSIATILNDKNLCELIAAGVDDVRCPKTYLSCVRGTYRDGNCKLLNIDTAISEVSNLGICVVKKSVDTSSGKDILICDFQNGVDVKSNKSCREIIESMGSDFIIQEKIVQWHELNTLYSKSLNTFRVMTYILHEDVYVCPLALRLGRGGADRDNIHYGGISIGVSRDGFLKNTAFSEYQDRFTQHPDSGIVFSGYHIDHVEKLVSAAKKLHTKMPQLKILSWDLTLDANAECVLIEINTAAQSAWFPQMVNGESLFGENTCEMLRDTLKR